jgi:hypothetical protein
MDKSEISELLTNVIVEYPCPVKWESMDGDDRVRICSDCKLHVHNLSSMSARDAAEVLKKRETERTCVFFVRKKDGSILVDNCPKRLRDVRNKTYTVAATALLGFAYGLYLSSSQMGAALVELHTKYSCLWVHTSNAGPNEVGAMADFGYDQARAIVRCVTALSFLFVFFLPLDKTKKESIAKQSIDLIALAMIPILVEVAGQFIVNNFGGLSGGGI